MKHEILMFFSKLVNRNNFHKDLYISLLTIKAFYAF
jgi:hypothetical protein